MTPTIKNDEVVMLTGNSAAAEAVKLCRVEVVPVFPISPQTTIMQKLTELISKGELDAEFIPAESEHSVMAAAIASQATGARTFTASSSQGILYMHENLFVASGCRLPIVMCMVNRGICAPLNFQADQLDSLSQRDTSWLQIYAENAQEVVDMVVQSFRIAEDERVLLPTAVVFEGYIVSHFLEPVQMPSQEYVDRFLPPYEGTHVRLDPDNVMHVGLAGTGEYYTEYKYQQQEAMENAKSVIKEVDAEYGKVFGRSYGGLIQGYMMDDAEVALLTLGSFSGAARTAVRELRKEGIKAGLIRMRFFRPFPAEDLREMARNLDALAVIDRNVSLGSGGIVFAETASALYGLKDGPMLLDFIMGLGGRDVTPEDMKKVIVKTMKRKDRGEVINPVHWYSVRGLEDGDEI